MEFKVYSIMYCLFPAFCFLSFAFFLFATVFDNYISCYIRDYVCMRVLNESILHIRDRYNYERKADKAKKIKWNNVDKEAKRVQPEK